MTQEKFLELTDKFNKGKCSSNEINLLYKFCEQAQFESIIAEDGISKEELIRVRLLKRVLQTIKNSEIKKRRILKFKKFRNIAAILIGVGVFCYGVLQLTNQLEPIKQTKEITLEFEDGSIQIIKENDTSAFFNKNGSILSRQRGNRIVYNNKDTVSRLTYNTLTVPYGKKFELELSDGTTAFLNAGTSITYPSKFIKNKKRQIIVTGEVFLSVAKDSLHPFVVNANGLNISVLGTEFNVSAYPEDNTSQVVLVEGAVALHKDSMPNKNSQTILKPGYMAVYDKMTDKIKTKPVITTLFTSWMNGEMVFRNMTFENIIKKLERHYDVKIINKNEDLNSAIFNASFGNISIKAILESLKDNYGIKYSIKKKTITIN